MVEEPDLSARVATSLPGNPGRRSPAYVFVPLIGLVISGLGFWSAWDSDSRAIKDQFERAASDRVDALSRAIELSLKDLESIHAFYNASQEVERAEFREFTRPLLTGPDNPEALEWIPRVARPQRAEFEAAARKEGLGNFQILDRDEVGELRPAPERDEYFPIFFAEPSDAMEQALGQDVSYSAGRLDAIRRATETGKAAATRRVTLTQIRSRPYGFLIFWPVYRKGMPVASPEERRAALQGLVAAVFRISRVVERSLEFAPENDLDMMLYDVSGFPLDRNPSDRPVNWRSLLDDEASPAVRRFLLYRPAGWRATDEWEEPGSMERPLNMPFERRIEVADRTWRVVCYPSKAFLAERRSWRPWGALAGGLGLTALASLYIGLLKDRNRRMRVHAEEREGLLRQLRAEREDLAALSEVTANAIRTLDLQDLLQTLLERMARVMRADSALVLLKEGQLLYAHAAVGFGEEDWRGVAFELGEGFAGTIASTGRSFYCEDAQVDPMIKSVFLKSQGVRSILGVPLKRDGEFTGVLQVNWKARRDCSDRERVLLEITGERCALAIRNAQLYAQARDLQQRLQIQFEKMPVGCIVLDGDGRIAMWNPAAERIFGFEAAEALGSHPSEILAAPGERPGFRSSLDRPEEEGGVSAFTARNVTRGRKDIICEWTKTVLPGPDGDPIGLLCMVQDVTSSRDLEAQLRQVQKMEAIGRLAGGVAHDFNNLLQVIRGYTQLALVDLQENGKTRQRLVEVLEGTERAAELTRQLLAFSRRQVLQFRDVNLNELISHLLKMLVRLIGEDIELNFIPGRDLGTVHADPTQLEQVVMNLCLNARDAISGGGTIVIETENVLFDSQYCAAHPWAVEGRYALLTVSDTGCGIAEEHQTRIFEPFFSTKEEGKGTGLGLAMTYGIVKQHEGSIHCYSEVGRGATFKIYLPIVERRAVSIGTKIEATVQGGRETILVAEDSHIVQRLVETILTEAGYHVLIASDGREAVRLFEQNRQSVQMAILDVVMPKLNGRAAYERMKALHPAIPVLFSSGYSADAMGREFLPEEKVELIQKPYDPKALLRKVREILDSACEKA